MSSMSEVSPTAEAGAVPLGTCRHTQCEHKGDLEDTFVVYAVGVWHHQDTFLEDK